MSDHKVELTELEKSGLHKHGLPIGCPSQLADSFRHGVKFALNNTGQKIEQAEARVSELVTALQDAVDIIQADANTEENYGSLCRMGSALAKDSSAAWLLRQKADAVESAAKTYAIKSATSDSYCYVDGLMEQVKEFRQAADEADTAGGGDVSEQ